MKTVRNIQIIFGNGINKFSDKSKKIRYYIPEAEINSNSFLFVIIKFRITDQERWNSFIRSGISSYAQFIRYDNENDSRKAMFSILSAYKIKNCGYIIGKVKENTFMQYIYDKRYNTNPSSGYCSEAYICTEHLI